MAQYGEQFEKTTIDDFREWNSLRLLDQIEPSYYNYKEKLAKEANTFKENGKTNLMLISVLLSDISSMCFTDQPNHPFDAFLKIYPNRSFAIEDLTPHNLDYLSLIVVEIDNYLLKARLADILWVTRKRFDMAKTAIENYIQTPINSKTWYLENGTIWKRAVALCNKLGRNEEIFKIKDDIKKRFMNQFLSEDVSDTSAHLGYANILTQLPRDEKENTEIEERLYTFSEELINKKNYYKARLFLNKLLQICKRDDNAKKSQLYLQIAETYCLDAEREAGNDMVAGADYESAIKFLRMIPQKYRPQWNIDERIETIRAKKQTSNSNAVFQMATLSTDGFDVTEAIKQSEQKVAGKDLLTALLHLCFIAQPISYQHIRDVALESIKQSPFAAMASILIYGENGRIVAQCKGVDIDDPESDSSKPAFWALMCRHYSLATSVDAQVAVLPALRTIELEHKITEDDIFQICYHANLIPPNRAHLWAKGLLFGFSEDFFSAMHLLAPQIEHMVRFLLQSKGIMTTIMEDGTECEIGLKALLKNDRISEVMSEDLQFELRALLIDPFGVNLRNQIAHGLVTDGYFNSSHPIYLWWLCLKFVILSNPIFLKLIHS